MTMGYVGGGYGCVGFQKTIVGIRNIYADGNGGNYTEDIIDYENNCIDDIECR
jgi:hypothetical protein